MTKIEGKGVEGTSASLEQIVGRYIDKVAQLANMGVVEEFPKCKDTLNQMNAELSCEKEESNFAKGVRTIVADLSDPLIQSQDMGGLAGILEQVKSGLVEYEDIDNFLIGLMISQVKEYMGMWGEDAGVECYNFLCAGYPGLDSETLHRKILGYGFEKNCKKFGYKKAVALLIKNLQSG
ncbi:hypothetical protein K8R20_00625 [bacterium]|nr:hypothetical protein [bacterium]